MLTVYDPEYEDWLTDSWLATEQWVIHYGWPFVVRGYRWDMSGEVLIHSGAVDPEGLKAEEPVTANDALFFTTATWVHHGINVWDEAGGTRPFIRFIGDYTRGAGNLGTDGTDLVWSYGEGKSPSSGLCPIRSIMTAPFTTDPATVAATAVRLRSQPSKSLYEMPWKVGCGYAAHSSDTTEILVVRLSGGWSWRVPIGGELLLTSPIGLSCEELFAGGYYQDSRQTIAAVQLDSLGPGEPPD